MAVRIPRGFEDRRRALLGQRWKEVFLPRREYGLHRDLHVAVGAILDADGHRQARSQLAMHLALGSSRTDRAPAHEVGIKLTQCRVEEFRSGRQPHLRDIGEQLAREAKPLVDVIRTVEIRVVDEPLPTHDRPRLLEVDAHHDENSFAHGRGEVVQACGVVDGRLGVVDGAGTDDDQQPLVAPVKDRLDRAPRIRHAVARARRKRNLLRQDRRGKQGSDAADPQVVGSHNTFRTCVPRNRANDAACAALARAALREANAAGRAACSGPPRCASLLCRRCGPSDEMPCG